MLRVLDSGSYIMGPEGRKFEEEFASALGLRSVCGVSSGTDALRIALEAVGVGPGDEVVVPSFTFIATATAVSALGAKPVFADISDDTLTLDAAKAAACVTARTKAVLPVHLYGQAADMDAFGALASERGLKIIEDCAQAHMTTYKGRVAGSLGHAAAFSFYPSKNLGAAGDGGAVSASEPAVAQAMLELRNCGRAPGGAAYDHVRIGQNCRLDELQAAILRVKLRRLADWTQRRRALAAVYDRELKGLPLRLPSLGEDGSLPSFHLYVLRSDNRDALAAHLAKAGIGTGIYYPIPAHLQAAYKSLGYKPGSLPVTEEASRTVLALPMFPELTERETSLVCGAVRSFFQ